MNKHRKAFSRKRRTSLLDSSRKNRLGSSGFESLESRTLLAADFWQNQTNSRDVNADGHVTPLDALMVINCLNTYGPRSLYASGPSALGLTLDLNTPAPPSNPLTPSGVGQVDVNGDGSVTPRDALAIINALAGPGPEVQIRVQATDSSGNPISGILPGQTYQLRYYVLDLRAAPDNDGVFSAYADVTYNSTLSSVNGPISYSTDYPNQHRGNTATAGLIDEAGAFGDAAFLGPTERLLLTVPMKASGSGVETFSLDPADLLGDDVSLYNDGAALTPDQIQFVGYSLEVASTPHLTIADASVVEGNAGTANMVFDVSLSFASTQQVTVGYTTQNNTATAGSDYAPQSGFVTFAAGDLLKHITVPVFGDVQSEGDETFFVSLSSPVNADINDAQGIGTIVDDDLPIMSIGDATVVEGVSGTTNAVFAITLSASSAAPITAVYSTADSSATTADNDYVAKTATVTFNPGQTSTLVTVQINGDTNIETDETFFVNLSNPVNSVIGDGQGLGTILNDDPTSPSDVQIYLDVTDLSGNPISSVDKGAQFKLRGFVQDARNMPEGVFAAYLDVLYNSTFVTPSGSIVHESQFTDVPSGSTSIAGLIDEVGGEWNSLTAPADPTAPQELFSIVMTGTNNGTVNFTLDPADQHPAHDVLLFGSDSAVPSSRIQFTGTSIIVGVNYLVISNATPVTEGNSGTKDMVFNVTRNLGSGSSAFVVYNTISGTATAGSDFVAGSGTLTFAPGSSTKQITVKINGDTLYENDESFTVQLSSPVGAILDTATATGTILNDDALPSISVSDASALEGGNLVFTVSLSASSGLPATVAYTTADSLVPPSATSGVDYQPISGTLTFAAGQTSQTLTVPAVVDAIDEPNEFFRLLLSAPNSATIGDGEGIGTIINDNPSRNISISDSSLVEGDGGAPTYMQFTISLSTAATQQITVGYATQDNTATAGSDYIAQSGIVTFAQGESQKTISIPILGDLASEGNETFFVNLSSAVGGVIVDGQGVGTIIDDDQQGLKINDVSVIEGNSGTTSAVFTITLAQASSGIVTVAYSTSNGTATAGSDYVATSGTVTFNPGQTTSLVTVQVLGDTTVETDETFNVNLSGAVNANIVDSQGVATILNDDPTPSKLARIRLQVTDLSDNPITAANQGDQFKLSAFVQDLRVAPPLGVFAAYLDVLYNSSVVSPAGPIVFSSTYTDVHSGSLVTPGLIDEVGAQTNSIDPLGGGEQLLFSIVMTANNNGLVNFVADPADLRVSHEVLVYGDNSAVLPPQVDYVGAALQVGTNFLTVTDVSKAEGNSGTTDFVFTVARTLGNASSASVVYATSPGTAAAGSDYTPISGTLSFAPGDSSKLVTVKVLGDTTFENDETFFLTLSNAVNVDLGSGSGKGTILNDDVTPSLAINSATGTEGNNVVFTVSLSAASGVPATVAYTTADALTGPFATAGVDYTPVSGTLTFAPGETSKSITVAAILDQITEPDEFFRVLLSSPANVTLGTATGVGRIISVLPTQINGTVYVDTNNDGVKQSSEIGIGGVLVSATNVATNVVTTAITADDGTYVIQAPPGTYNVSETQPGFYVDGIDTPGTPAPQSTQNDRFVGVTLGSGAVASGFNFGERGLRAEFVNLFLYRRAYLASSLFNGPYGGTTSAQNIDLTHGDVWVSFDGGWNGLRKIEALFQSQYGSVSMTLYDNNLKTLATSVATDTPPSITYNGTLGSAYFLKISGTNPDVAIRLVESLTVADASMLEGDSGTTSGVFTVTISNPIPSPVTLTYTTADGTALAIGDYIATTGTITLAAGATSTTITIPIVSDLISEGAETFLLNLSGASPSVFLTKTQVVGTIVDNDPLPQLSISDVQMQEGPAAGTTNFVFTVTLNGATSQTVMVGYTTANGTAKSTSDYVATSGTITFAPGVPTRRITIQVLGDYLNEPDETFMVNLIGPVNASIARGTGIGTIQNDDGAQAALALAMSSEDDWIN